MTFRRTLTVSALMLPLFIGAAPVVAADANDTTSAPAQFIIGEAGQVITNDAPVSTSDSFLTQNKAKPGVVTLKDGLQYKVIEKGHGQKPTLNDTVTVDYAGTLTDGTEFDSSYKRGQPASFPVSGVIAGWTEALQLMPVGSTWELYIPATLAYGDQGAPPQIGPNQTLIFKVKLISIDKNG